MVLGDLYHAVVFLGREVHVVIFRGVVVAATDDDLVVEVRSGGFPRVADLADDLPARNLLSNTDAELIHVAVERLEAVAVVDHDALAVALFPRSVGNFPVAGGVNLGAHFGGEVHAAVEVGRAVNRVDAHAVARSGALEVFVGNGLDGGDALAALLLVLAHLDKFFQGIGFDVKLFAKHIHLLGGGDNEFGVGEFHQMLVAVAAAETRFADRFGDGLGLEDGAIEVLVALLDVVEDFEGVVEAELQDFVLRLEEAVLLAELRFLRRIDEVHYPEKRCHTEDNARAEVAQDGEETVARRRVETLVIEGIWIIEIVCFTRFEQLH